MPGYQGYKTNKHRNAHKKRRNKRLHWAYILAGFSVLRERTESLTVFNKLLLSAFLSLLTWRVMEMTLEQVHAMTNWRYQNC